MNSPIRPNASAPTIPPTIPPIAPPDKPDFVLEALSLFAEMTVTADVDAAAAEVFETEEELLCMLEIGVLENASVEDGDELLDALEDAEEDDDGLVEVLDGPEEEAEEDLVDALEDTEEADGVDADEEAGAEDADVEDLDCAADVRPDTPAHVQVPWNRAS
ncbi:hypothetical protein QFC20_007463 [Naganishia adeliensis]|uniref:Uncharacterized protein n=1 Tax=Naganishia adeliensis TaxID=92952 RepID=A0ACC2UZ60_9TREE|nr:hypothetical protein QFC20_007463 [Naganishia adeliensis]